MNARFTYKSSYEGISIEALNPFVIESGTARILLNGGEFAVISLVDLPLVAHLRWSADGKGYAQANYWCNGKLKHPRLHRFLFGSEADGWSVDHINGLRWDCRRANLRLCTREQNALNRGANTANSTGYKGVRRKAGFYMVQIKTRGQQYRVGQFDTPEEAARAYDFLARKFFGEWARLNFPDGADEAE